MPRKLIAAALTAGMSMTVIVILAMPALAKGPTQARITGPGLDRAIVISGGGEPTEHSKLATLAGQTGLFAVLFGAVPGMPALTPLRSAPPGASLGPKYTLIYTVPGLPSPSQMDGQYRQYLYPDAGGGPVIYTPPGQPSWAQYQLSAWVRGGPQLLSILGRLGVKAVAPPQAGKAVASYRPRTTMPPAPHASGKAAVGVATWLVAAIAMAAATALAGSALLLRRRAPIARRGGRAQVR